MGEYTCKEDLDHTAVPGVLISWTQAPSPAAASSVIYVFVKGRHGSEE